MRHRLDAFVFETEPRRESNVVTLRRTSARMQSSVAEHPPRHIEAAGGRSLGLAGEVLALSPSRESGLAVLCVRTVCKPDKCRRQRRRLRLVKEEKAIGVVIKSRIEDTSELDSAIALIVATVVLHH